MVIHARGILFERIMYRGRRPPSPLRMTAHEAQELLCREGLLPHKGLRVTVSRRAVTCMNCRRELDRAARVAARSAR